MDRDFKGVWIPREIWELESLGWSEKILLVEVDSLDVNGTGCYASNAHLAKFLGVSKDRVSRMVSRLVKDNYLVSRVVYKPDGKEVDKRFLWLNKAAFNLGNTPPAKTPIPPGKNTDTPPGKNTDTPPVKTPKGVIHKSNTSLSNTDKRKKSGKAAAPSPAEIVDLFHSLCPSLPKIVKLTDGRKTAIKARLDEYSMEQITQAFRMAEQSDFLKGKSERGWTANLDWLMKPGNMAKVLEGNYVNKAAGQSTANKPTTDRYANIDEEETL